LLDEQWMSRGAAIVGFLLGLSACGADPIEDDAGPADAGASDLGVGIDAADSGTDSDVGMPVDGAVRVTIGVEHDRELRGAWVATVSNINFPSNSNLSASAQKVELDSLIDLLADHGFNAVFFQVRPECDAFYPSAIEPWSRYLTGTQGEDPGYDPLGYLIEKAHARGVEVHAWLNPYRAKASFGSTAVAPHVSLTLASHAVRYGNALWLDPGAQPVRDHLLAVIDDLIARYDVDGVHFDDYFYPYPNAGEPFPDDASFAAYQAGGGTMSLGDWRRDNVHQMVEAVHDTIAMNKPQVRFGIAPFGIYRPGMPAGITGLDQYAEIYSDPLRWMDEGWVDYLAPQLYWPSTQTRQAYAPLLEWWSATTAEGRSIFAGNYLSQLGSSAAWDVAEIRTQVELSRAQRPAGSLGNIFYSVAPLLEDRDSIRALFTDVYASPARPPPIAALRARTLDPPSIVEASGTLELAHPSATTFLVYRLEASGSRLIQVVSPPSTIITLSSGAYAISVIDRAGVESRGAAVDIP
jgi:uncharacterized lipoprotein YddW (UPF0748 family)